MAKNSDALVAVVDTTVPLSRGTVEINGEEVSSTASKTLVPGDVVRKSDLDPKFVESVKGDDTVLRDATAADLARFAVEEAPAEEAPAEEVEEVPYVAPVDDGTAGDSGRDLEAEKPKRGRKAVAEDE